MSTAARDAYDSLKAGLKTVPELRQFELGQAIDIAGLVVGMPGLQWETYGNFGGGTPPPTTARFVVFLVVPMDPRAMARLFDHIEDVTAAVETVENAVVISAEPGFYNDNTANKPCYTISVEMGLT